jgi:hypothetical protein
MIKSEEGLLRPQRLLSCYRDDNIFLLKVWKYIMGSNNSAASTGQEVINRLEFVRKEHLEHFG